MDNILLFSTAKFIHKFIHVKKGATPKKTVTKLFLLDARKFW